MGTYSASTLNQIPFNPDKVRVLILDLSKRYGGASTRAITLAKGLREWEPAIGALAGSPVARTAAQDGIPVVTFGSSRIDPRIPFRIAQAIRSGGYQLIDTQNIQAQVWGSLGAAWSGAALVSTLNSSYVEEQGQSLKGRIYSLLQRLTSWRVDRYIAVSDPIKKWLCDSGIAPQAIDLIRNGIAIERTRPVPEPGQVRSSLGLRADDIVCVAVGRLVWAKGYADLVEAFARLAIPVPNARLVIVGEGALHAELEAQIDRAGLSERVLLAGHCDHERVLGILSASNIFVMSSRSEGVPYALLEAGALGLPILATRCGGIPEVVRDGEEALLVNPGDISGLASGLAALCMDRERARDFGARARQRIREEFSLSAEITATQNTYRIAAGKRMARNGSSAGKEAGTGPIHDPE